MELDRPNIAKTARYYNKYIENYNGTRGSAVVQDVQRTAFAEMEKINKTWNELKIYSNDKTRWSFLLEALCSQVE